MKKILLLAASVLALTSAVNAQTTAMDFTQMDCSGTSHNLFTNLDAGKVVIMEWYMGPSCQPCKDAAKEIEGLKAKMLASYPGKIMSYAWGFQDSYTCSATQSWVSGLGVSAIPMDTGAAHLAYYGGFSMPTIVVVAGPAHKVIYIANPGNGGYSNGDTAAMRTAIKNFFSPTSVASLSSNVAEVTVFPSPAQSDVTIQVQLKAPATVFTQIVNLAGQVVIQIPSEKVSGTYSKLISTEALASGIYTVRIIADGNVITRTLSIAK